MNQRVKYLLSAALLLQSSVSLAYEITKELCPTKPQKVLVIDLKSGWWAGDGGDFGKDLMTKWKEVCGDSISFEYQHRTFANGGYPGGGGFGFGNFGEAREEVKFPKDEWTSYSQIWLLSGGEADSVDLRTDTDLWRRYRDGIISSGANLFVGGSFGNIYHANALTRELGLGDAFVTDRQAHEYPTPASGVEGKSTLVRGRELLEGPLFEGIYSIVDDLQVGPFLMVSDSLNVATPGLKIVGSNSRGNASIGVLDLASRKFVFDAGVHRFYGILNRGEDTLKYLQNISRVLGR